MTAVALAAYFDGSNSEGSIEDNTFSPANVNQGAYGFVIRLEEDSRLSTITFLLSDPASSVAVTPFNGQGAQVSTGLV